MLQYETSFLLPDNDITADSHSLEDDFKSLTQEPSSQALYLPAEMQSEHARLRTFYTWPKEWATTLASNGFYATKDGDCIRCAFCGLEISGFSSTQEVQLWHWQVTGWGTGCPFLTGKRGGQKEETEANIGRRGGLSRETTLHVESSRRTERLQLLKSTPGNVSPISDRPRISNKSSSETSQCAMPTSLLSRESVSQRLTSRCGSNSSHAIKSGMERRQLQQERTEQEKSASFVPNPTKSTPGSSTPASSVPAASTVKSCIPPESTSAGSTLKNSTPASSTPAGSTPASSSPSRPSPGSTPWANIVQTARVPHMVPYEKRLLTFSSWPLLSPTPETLARAGFFRDTHPDTSRLASSRPLERDAVCCFWCGERVHRWQKSDDPVLEHIRLSPGCQYAKELMGGQVHRDVTAAARSVDK